MAGTLSPDARLRILSDLGLIAPGAKLNTYVSGTPSTPLATYSESTLTNANANPIIASAGGLFGPIYLTPGVAYKYVLTDTLGNPIWSQDPVATPGNTALLDSPAFTGTPTAPTAALGTNTTQLATTAFVQAAQGDNGVNTFRLTLTTGVPVTTADVLAATTLFCTPTGRGNRIALYDSGGVTTIVTSAQVSIAIPATTSQVYDVFGFNNAGVFTLELLAWTNDTTRATALVLSTTGTYTKSGDLTRRYLGSIRTTTVSGQCEDSFAKRYVWNYSNRVPRIGKVLEATASWAYSLTTWRQARAQPTNQLDFVIGVAEVALEATVLATASSSALDNAYVAIGEDSTTTPSTSAIYGRASEVSSGIQINPTATVRLYPAVGRHTYVWLEQSGAGGTMTWVGTNTGVSAAQSGIIGRIDG